MFLLLIIYDIPIDVAECNYSRSQNSEGFIPGIQNDDVIWILNQLRTSIDSYRVVLSILMMDMNTRTVTYCKTEYSMQTI